MRINRVIEVLTFSDILLLSGWGLVNPIFAVFVREQIIGGSIALVGLAATTYLLTKGVLQIPVARFIDRRRGEWDDYRIMIAGSLIISFAAFLYTSIQYPWQLFSVQAVLGVGAALAYPSWYAIFTRHIDKKEEGFEWSIFYTATDFGAAIAAGIGGIIASSLGYDLLFVLVGIFSLTGTLLLAKIGHYLKKRSRITP